MNLRIANIISQTFVKIGTEIKIQIIQATDAQTARSLDHYVGNRVITAQVLSQLQLQLRAQQFS